MLRCAIDSALRMMGHEIKANGDNYHCATCDLTLAIPDEMDRDAAKAMFDRARVQRCSKEWN